jgi:D-alanine-D-alanine ligase
MVVSNPTVPGADELRGAVSRVIESARQCAPTTTVVFVTNLSEGPIVDVDETGIVHTSQYYTQSQADVIIRTFQDAGFHVLSYFSEREFMTAALSGELRANSRVTPVVYTAAEGGTGAGRRALIPAFCNLLGLAVCNSGPHGCSVARHKFHANAVLQRAGLRVPQTWMYSAQRGWVSGSRPDAGGLVILKPTYESMAIGIDNDSVLVVGDDIDDKVMMRARYFKQPVVVQEFVTGYEVGVPIIEIGHPRALPIIGFGLDGAKRYGARPRTFADENLSNRVQVFPFEGLSAQQYGAIQRAGVRAFEALDMAGMGRIDMRLDDDGRFWIIDTNESPPPLAGTSYGTSLGALGFNTIDMLSLWIGVTLQRYDGSVHPPAVARS